MTNSYRWVQWNRHKLVYDLVLAGLVVAYLGLFVGVSTVTREPAHRVSTPITLMRALATLAVILLHIILAIGPVARLTPRAAPLLYNRRHLGVMFFFLAAAHALLAVGFYGGFGVRNPLSAVAAANTSFSTISGFPFEVPGLIALVTFAVMAATSHDFWLANLSPRVWKSIHMAVYPAYGLVMLHIVLGALQSERHPLFAALAVAGPLCLGALHVLVGVREWRRDAVGPAAGEAAWIDAAAVGEIEDGRAKVICLRDRDRIALFRDGDRYSAVSNSCAHQAGPLGEGRIIDGCITCPWHGYQYRPADGQSPPPYTEKIPTYAVRIEGLRILVSTAANPPGTFVEPARAASPPPGAQP